MDVAKFKCVFLQRLSAYLRKKQWGAVCAFPELLKIFASYIFILDSGCDPGEELLKKIQDFYNTYVDDGSFTSIDPEITTCGITLSSAKADAVECSAITLTVL